MKRKPSPAPGGEVVQYLDFPGPVVPAGTKVLKLIPIGDGGSGPSFPEPNPPLRHPASIRPFENFSPDVQTLRALFQLRFGSELECSRLSKEEMQVLDLIYFERQSISETALALGIARLTCREYFQAALIKIKAALNIDPAFQVFASILHHEVQE